MGSPTRPPGNWKQLIDWPFELSINMDTWNSLTAAYTGALGSLDDLTLDMQNPRQDWTRFMGEWEKLLLKVERRINDLKQRWLTDLVGRQIMEMAERTVARTRALVQEASVAPVALMDDIEVWRGRAGQAAGIKVDASRIQDHTSLRAIDSEMQGQGSAARRPWRGRVRDAYVSHIPEQSAAVGHVVNIAGEVINVLQACLVSAVGKYAAWAMLLFQILVVLARFTLLDITILFDSGEYATLSRLWLSAEAASKAAEISLDNQKEKLSVLLSQRPGLKQEGQISPNGGRPDRLWPNPFNDVNYLRAEVVRGRVRIDGGPKLAINNGW